MSTLRGLNLKVRENIILFEPNIIYYLYSVTLIYFID